jgi:hypothetical protein
MTEDELNVHVVRTLSRRIQVQNEAFPGVMRWRFAVSVPGEHVQLTVSFLDNAFHE